MSTLPTARGDYLHVAQPALGCGPPKAENEDDTAGGGCATCFLAGGPNALNPRGFGGQGPPSRTFAATLPGFSGYAFLF
ncbi:MAG: hypothetical protein JWN24_963 [Phycisphaerales bacterium]|nr:hypothetical protein [Phycisphaerales bacterium]